MIRHVVMFRWNDDVTDAQIDATIAGLHALPAAIDTIRAYRFGRNAGINPDTFDFSVTADFDDEAGYIAYRDHPVHQALIAEHIAGRLKERASIQFHVVE